MKNLRAILFDLDGTLADTMQDNFQAWRMAFHTYGIEIRREDYFPLEGMRLIKIAGIIAVKYHLNINPEEIVNLKNKYYLQNHSFSFYPDVLEFIDFLRTRKKLLAIVSASPKEKLEKTVPGDFLDKFDAIISGDDTKEGKPSPEPYLIAMDRLQVSPEESLVIENAPLGIMSAKSAGIRCIAITTTLAGEYLKEADKIISNHRELFSYFK